MRTILSSVMGVSLLCPTIAQARVDSGTPHLIRTAENLGISLAYNPSSCRPGIGGTFVPARKLVTLCYHGRPTADDHNTVRHEMFHVVQFCASTYRRYNTLYPVISDQRKLKTWVTGVLTPRTIAHVYKSYPQDRWPVELEAFAAAKKYTAHEIAELMVAWCNHTPMTTNR